MLSFLYCLVRNNDLSIKMRTTHSDIDIRLLKEAYASLTMSTLLTICVVITFYIILKPLLLPTEGMLWVSVLIAVALLRYLTALIYNRQPFPEIKHQRWKTIFLIGAILSGLSWIFGPIIMMPPAKDPMWGIFIGTLLCISAVGTITLSPQVMAVRLFHWTMMGPLVLMLLLSEAESDRIAGLVVIAGTAILGTVGIKLGQNLRSRLRNEQQLVEAIAEAKREKSRADAANLAKSHFLSNMSHELRTPLNAVLGYSQILEMDHNASDETLDAAREITEAGRHLLSLVNEILDLAAIESGKLEFNLEPVSVADLLQKTRSLIIPLASKLNVEAEIPLPKENLYVHADYVRARQVLLNLLSNAIKYNRPGGKTWVKTKRKRNSLKIEVIDNGEGIAKDKQGKLFHAFERLGKEAKVEGTGIGLVITKELVEAMNGRMTFTSEEGVGSTFAVELPLAEA